MLSQWEMSDITLTQMLFSPFKSIKEKKTTLHRREPEACPRSHGNVREANTEALRESLDNEKGKRSRQHFIFYFFFI
uniref:Uncharacterized protein n=1 Tax=Neogobius melanostomus TaxID=47308 RepID=A0A8C6TK76_9GOBI